MTDALGRPNSVLVLGGTSDIALATAKRLADRGARTIALLGRHPEAMLAAAEPLREAGATVHALPFDASDPVGCVAAVEEAFRTYGDFDVVLLAFGILGDQQRYEADPEAAARDCERRARGRSSCSPRLLVSARAASCTSTAPRSRASTRSRLASTKRCAARARA